MCSIVCSSIVCVADLVHSIVCVADLVCSSVCGRSGV